LEWTSRHWKRAYAVAREFEPLLVNTVVGFIGPEYLFDGREILRAGHEDHFCGKLLGVPMGVTCVIRTTRKPPRTIWTRFSPCSARLA
jgi:ethanolamine ammonia-lyase large subunit